MAVQSCLAGCEPNTTVELSSAEVTNVQKMGDEKKRVRKGVKKWRKKGRKKKGEKKVEKRVDKKVKKKVVKLL